MKITKKEAKFLYYILNALTRYPELLNWELYSKEEGAAIITAKQILEVELKEFSEDNRSGRTSIEPKIPDIAKLIISKYEDG